MLIIISEKDGSDYPVDKDLGAHRRKNHQESHFFKSIYLYAVVGALCAGEQAARMGEGKESE